MIPTESMLTYAWRAGQNASRLSPKIKLHPLTPELDIIIDILNSGRGIKVLNSDTVDFGKESKQINTVGFGVQQKRFGHEMGYTLPTDPTCIALSLDAVLSWKSRDPKRVKKQHIVEKEVASWTVHELTHAGDKRTFTKGSKVSREFDALLKQLTFALQQDDSEQLNSLQEKTRFTYFTMPEEIEAYEAQRIADAIYRISIDSNERELIQDWLDHLEIGYKANQVLMSTNMYQDVDTVWTSQPKIWKKFIANFRLALEKLADFHIDT